MSECNHDCAHCSENCSERKFNKEDFLKPQNKDSNVKNVIAIVSGKGGVGKSMVTSLLAVSMAKQGKHVGILDADITGASIPKVFGIEGMATGSEDGIDPKITRKGIKLISSNLLLEDPTDPIIWRGPVISGLVEQFWTDVKWGDIDYLFCDMPPGTGDVPLTVFQSLPVKGIIIVTSPQDLVSMIVEKAAKMAEKMEIPILGIVENMSYFECPNCGEKHYIFGNSHIDEIAAQYCVDTVERLPIDATLPALADQGLIEEYDGDSVRHITKKIIDTLER